MRRHPSRLTGASSLLFGAAVVAFTAIATVGPAAAAFAVDPTPTAGADAGAGANANLGPATAGTAICTLANAALSQISGIVVTDKGTLAVEARTITSKVTVWTLDANCKATSKSYTSGGQREPQDMAVAADGTIWIADTGDKDGSRKTIAVHKIAPGAAAAVINRMTYPDGAKHAAAFLLGPEDVPIILANVSGKPGVSLYKPTKALVPNDATGTALEKVGEFAPTATGTSNPAGPVGASSVTGAAKSPDGKKVVIRTASDAYEWDVPDGDVVKAITTTKARITPLPDEPDGEAISYSADGTKFVTMSFKATGATDNPKLLSYTPFVPAAVNPNATGAPDPGGAGDTTAEQSWFSKLSFSELTRIVAAVGVVGLVLAIAGIVGIRRARKRRREEEDEYDDYDDDYDDRPRRGRGAAGGRGRDDDGYGGARDPQYAEGYDNQYGGQYAEAGYGANGYGANGYGAAGYGEYAEAGYGQDAAAGYGANGHANGYGQQGYGADAYGQPQQYAPQQDYGAGGGYEGHGQQQYGPEQYGDQYADPYGGQQQYGDYGAQGQQQQQYGGGYGYEEFDPMQDPRRR
jgi:hypothetical protein